MWRRSAWHPPLLPIIMEQLGYVTAAMPKKPRILTGGGGTPYPAGSSFLAEFGAESCGPTAMSTTGAP